LESADSVGLACAYRDLFGLGETYVADLDAILGRQPQPALVRDIAACSTTVWVDAGVASVDAARQLRAAGAARVIVGLETLPSYAHLAAIADAVGPDAVACSLDLKGGALLIPGASAIPREPVEIVARRAADSGAGSVIVLDLARVGMGTGLDLAIIEQVRSAVPDLTLVAGGGVRGPADLRHLCEAGCDAALVASALHEGCLAAADCHPRVTR
jgi:phosphoribosylformimino-5-aminoimidazole carboxamide ribotide isomerase